MNNLYLSPLVEVGTNEEAAPGTFGAALPTQFLPEQKNYAKNVDVVKHIMLELYPALQTCRDDRQALNEEWRTIRNMNLMTHDEGRRYFGRSDSYIPVYKKTRSTLVSTLSRGLFPSDEYMDVIDLRGNVESSRPLKAYMQWELDKIAQLRRVIKPTLSQLVDYGNSPLKFWYKKKLKNAKLSSLKAQMTSGSFGADQYGEHCVYDGLAVSPRNLFYWYIYPNTAETLDDAQIIFEDIDLPRAKIEEMKRLKRWENVDEAMLAYSNTDHDQAQLELLTARGLSDVPGRSNAPGYWQYTVTEVWTFMKLPASAYLQWEDSNDVLPVRVVLAGDVPLEVTRNPFFHQKAPYVCPRIDWEPGCFYGTSTGRVVRPLQMLSNDFMNQMNDNGIMAMNPVTIMNPNLMVGKPRPFAPGVVWYANDVPSAVRFDRPPIDTTGLGIQLANMVISMGQDFGGAPPVLQGVGAGRAAKTATGAQILQKNAVAPLQDIVEDIEIEAMVPLLRGAWKNAVQYRDQSVMTYVAGQSVEVTPEQLAIDADFKWLGSSQAINSQMRNQQALSLMQAIAPFLPQIMSMGYIVDFVPLIRKVYVDGFGFRGFQEFIRKAQAAPNAQVGQAALPEQIPGIQAEQADSFRSALDQVQGAGQELAPGEGEDFNAMRQMVESQTGQMGALGGEVEYGAAQ